MKEGAGTKNEPDGEVMMTKVASSSRELTFPAPSGVSLSMRYVAYSHPRPKPEASYPFHVEIHVRRGMALPQPGRFRDRNGYLITG